MKSNEVSNKTSVANKVETTETIEQKLAKLKEEQAKLKAMLEEQKEKAKAEAQKLKEETAKLRAAKMKQLLDEEPKVNKSEQIRRLLLEGKDRDQIAAELGYKKKFVSDNIWRIEKQLGLR